LWTRSGISRSIQTGPEMSVTAGTRTANGGKVGSRQKERAHPVVAPPRRTTGRARWGPLLECLRSVYLH
jgi:hypothetical protein